MLEFHSQWGFSHSLLIFSSFSSRRIIMQNVLGYVRAVRIFQDKRTTDQLPSRTEVLYVNEDKSRKANIKLKLTISVKSQRCGLLLSRLNSIVVARKIYYGCLHYYGTFVHLHCVVHCSHAQAEIMKFNEVRY